MQSYRQVADPAMVPSASVAFTVFHKYFLTAQFIFSIFHTACHHGITDQNDTFRSEHTECFARIALP